LLASDRLDSRVLAGGMDLIQRLTLRLSHLRFYFQALGYWDLAYS